MGKGILIGIVIAVLSMLGIWLAVAYSGVYNVAASDLHADPVRWTLETTMRHSVAARAETGDDSPGERFDQASIAAGAEHYAESCVLCHGAPGVEPETWARGMRPEPPHLAEAAAEWSAEEIRWIVTNGIKMTGMPAFGSHHDDDELLAITAFVNELPGLSSADYAALAGGTDGAAASPDGRTAQE